MRDFLELLYTPKTKRMYIAGKDVCRLEQNESIFFLPRLRDYLPPLKCHGLFLCFLSKGRERESDRNTGRQQGVGKWETRQRGRKGTGAATQRGNERKTKTKNGEALQKQKKKNEATVTGRVDREYNRRDILVLVSLGGKKDGQLRGDALLMYVEKSISVKSTSFQTSLLTKFESRVNQDVIRTAKFF